MTAITVPEKLKKRALALANRDKESKEVVEALLELLGVKVEKPIDAATALNGASYVLHDLSLVLPERRKVEVGLFDTSLTVVGGKKVLASGTWKTYSLALCLAVPEKARKTWNLVLMARSGSDAVPPIMIQVPDVSADKYLANAKPTMTLRSQLLSLVAPHVTDVLDSEDAVVVPAHYGSREGILFLLQEFMFFGFRKPVMLIPLDQIESVSYTVITRLTFNIVVRVAGELEYEFGMIPHSHYDKINPYVSLHGLNDASMAAERQAKKAKTEPSELAKAAEELENDGQGFIDSDEDEGSDFSAPLEGSSGGSGESESESEIENEPQPEGEPEAEPEAEPEPENEPEESEEIGSEDSQAEESEDELEITFD